MSNIVQSARLELLALSARAVGLISEMEYEDMTDGRVSFMDRKAATDIASGKRAEGDIARALGAELRGAIQDEIDGQGFFKTMSEDVAEFFPRIMDRPEKPEAALARPQGAKTGVNLRG